MLKRIEEWILEWLQRRCSHPSKMVAVDILQGDFEELGVSYCNRCGAVRINLGEPGEWRRPSPRLWR